MNEKVLFLDFDGPLFSDKMIALHPDNGGPHLYPDGLTLSEFISYWKMDELSVVMLNKLYDIYPFKTVISSSWSKLCEKEQIEKLFDVNNLKLEMHDVWTTPKKMSSERIHEISWWIDKNKPADYIILDDGFSGSSINPGCCHLAPFGINHERVFLIDVENGIDYQTFIRMRDLVLTW